MQGSILTIPQRVHIVTETLFTHQATHTLVSDMLMTDGSLGIILIADVRCVEVYAAVCFVKPSHHWLTCLDVGTDARIRDARHIIVYLHIILHAKTFRNFLGMTMHPRNGIRILNTIVTSLVVRSIAGFCYDNSSKTLSARVLLVRNFNFISFAKFFLNILLQLFRGEETLIGSNPAISLHKDFLRRVKLDFVLYILLFSGLSCVDEQSSTYAQMRHHIMKHICSPIIRNDIQNGVTNNIVILLFDVSV